MSIQTFKSKVSEHSLLKGDFQHVALELVKPNHIDFQAGQYIMLTVPGIEQKRSYSIASPPSANHKVEIVVDVKPDGPGCQYLKSLKPGDEVEFMAPAGQFVVVDDDSEKELDFIATGSGITPIRAMILDLLQDKQDQRPIHLHWGMRFVDDVFWEEDFHQLEENFPNFHVDIVLSKPPQHWPLCAGHVGDCLVKHHQSFDQTGFYICGNTRMVKEVSQMLKENNVKDSNIHHEKFY